LSFLILHDQPSDALLTAVRAAHRPDKSARRDGSAYRRPCAAGAKRQYRRQLDPSSSRRAYTVRGALSTWRRSGHAA